MTSPRSGFRRAAIASWALAGLGVAGVAGASEMAYADTLKPPAAEPVDASPEALLPTEQAIPADIPLPTAAPTEPPQAPAPEPIAAPAPAAPAYTPPPAPVYKQAPQYTPPAPQYTQTYVPPAPAPAPPAPAYTPPVQQAPVQQAPAAPAPSQGGFPIRHSNVSPGGGGGVSSGNKFSPSHTASRGS